MAAQDNDTGTPAHRIQFDEPIHPVVLRHSNASKNGEKESMPSEKVHSIDDEEQARRIADEDLNRIHKQVSSSPPPLCCSGNHVPSQ